MHGELGVLATDGTRVQCHVCAAWFVQLGHHVVRTHGLPADEYKAYFGLRASTGLVGPLMREAQRLKAERDLAPHRAEGPKALRRLTSEQRAQYVRGHRLPVESRRDPAVQAQWRQAGQRIHEKYLAGSWSPPTSRLDPHELGRRAQAIFGNGCATRLSRHAGPRRCPGRTVGESPCSVRPAGGLSGSSRSASGWARGNSGAAPVFHPRPRVPRCGPRSVPRPVGGGGARVRPFGHSIRPGWRRCRHRTVTCCASTMGWTSSDRTRCAKSGPAMGWRTGGWKRSSPEPSRGSSSQLKAETVPSVNVRWHAWQAYFCGVRR